MVHHRTLYKSLARSLLGKVELGLDLSYGNMKYYLRGSGWRVRRWRRRRWPSCRAAAAATVAAYEGSKAKSGTEGWRLKAGYPSRFALVTLQVATGWERLSILSQFPLTTKYS